MPRKNLCDVLGQNARYVVLSKNDRTQIFGSPPDNVIRDKIKKGWELVGWVRKEENEAILMVILTNFYQNKLKETA